MTDRLGRQVISLLLWLVAVSFGARILIGHVAHGHASSQVAPAASVSDPLAAVILVVLTVPFALGLAVRLTRFLTNPGAHSAKERASRERAIRQRVRRPAEGVAPFTSGHEYLSDPDPAVNDEAGATDVR